MLLSAIAPQTLVCNSGSGTASGGCNLLVCPNNHKVHSFSRPNSFTQKPLILTNSSNSLGNNTSQLQNPDSYSKTLRHGSLTDSDDAEGTMVASASALASAIRRASTSPVDFIQKIEKVQKNGLLLPSPDFQRLCLEQLDLFRRIVDPNALLSVYVRPAGSYVIDRLELRRVTFYPGVNGADIVILVGNFGIPTGLRVAEAALSSQQAEVIPECRAVVFPMVKHPFIVGFLVAELPMVEDERGRHPLTHFTSPEESYALSPQSDIKLREIQAIEEETLKSHNFTADQRLNAINISRSLAMAYVMDQKAMLLQQSSWQNNVRMSDLVEQIRGPLSSIRTLSKMLSLHMKRSEIANDIVEDIVVQGDRMRDALQQLQDAVHLTKANIVRYNEETLKKMQKSTYAQPDSVSHLSDNFWRETSSSKAEESGEPLSLASAANDLDLPTPSLALAHVSQHDIRPCNVYDILVDLVGAVRPLAHKQQRKVELIGQSQTLQVAVEEPALRQALSNLIEGALLRTHVGGKIEILSTGTPAGGALVVIDDDGPDMHYMTQTHSLTPFGAGLLSEDMVEDNMTWNFVAGLTVACEILESYGCAVHVISPRSADAALGAGGTRVKIWLPAVDGACDLNSS